MSSVLLAGALNSCSGYFEDPYYSDWYKIDDSKIPSYVDNSTNIYCWVFNNIKYQIHGTRCFLPQETLNNGYGDCDDDAVLQLAIYFKRCGKKGSLLVGTNSEGIGHAEADFCGETFYRTYLFNPTKEYSFDDIKFFHEFYAPN
ncbi:Uncharacterised protein [uncultured archaeon]|nr:Uncharacterised protein [uncultured archaeon]